MCVCVCVHHIVCQCVTSYPGLIRLRLNESTPPSVGEVPLSSALRFHNQRRHHSALVHSTQVVVGPTARDPQPCSSGHAGSTSTHLSEKRGREGDREREKKRGRMRERERETDGRRGRRSERERERERERKRGEESIRSTRERG